MAHVINNRVTRPLGPVVVREVALSAPLAWLGAGWRDLRQSMAFGLGVGFVVAVAGWLLLLAAREAAYAVPALLGGFLLVAPFAAIVLYEVSAQIEDEEPLDANLAWGAWQRNAGAIGMLGLLLALVLLAWERLSALIFALFLGNHAPGLNQLGRELLFSGQYTPLLLAYFGTGALLAALVFAFSVVTAPMLMDEPVDVVTAALVSWRCCARNPATMLVWAVLIAALTAIGMATLLMGLIVVFPWLGHASWHAYRDLVEVQPVSGNR
jgi:uncharacterized membrane protein